MTDAFPIMAAVAAHPSHPYQLLEHLHAMGIKTTRSTLYRHVDALVEAQLLRTEDVRGPSGHFRRSMTLTAKGKARLARDAVSVLAQESLESPLFGLAVAAAGSAGLDEALDVLKKRVAAAARTLTEEERAFRDSDEESWQQAARERRVFHLQADIAWLQGLLRRRSAATRESNTERGSSPLAGRGHAWR